MSTRRLCKLLIMLLLLCALAGWGGCSKKGSEQKPEGDQKQTQTEEPESFTNIVKETESLIMAIGRAVEFIQIPTSTPVDGMQGEKGGQKQAGEQGQQGQENGAGQVSEQGQQGEQGQEGGQEQEGEEGQEDEQLAKEAPQPQDIWPKAEEGIRTIHQEWNNLEPEVLTAGLPAEERDGFEKTMEGLTMNITAQKPLDSLIGAIEMYGFYGSMASALKSSLPAPAYNLKYEIMIMAGQAYAGDWALAQAHSEDLTQQWEMLKMKDEASDDQIFTQSEYAINDFKRAVLNKQKELTLIKAEIALENLDELGQNLLQAKVMQNDSNKKGAEEGSD